MADRLRAWRDSPRDVAESTRLGRTVLTEGTWHYLINGVEVTQRRYDQAIERAQADIDAAGTL